MRMLLTIPTCMATVLSLATQTAPRRGRDETAIRAVVSKYVDARQQSDARAIEALFTADADQLVSSGEWRKGCDAVVCGTLKLEGTPPANSPFPPKYISRSINQLLYIDRLGGLISCYSGMKGECVLALLGRLSRHGREMGSREPTQKPISLISRRSFRFVPQNSFFLRPGPLAGLFSNHFRSRQTARIVETRLPFVSWAARHNVHYCGRNA